MAGGENQMGKMVYQRTVGSGERVLTGLVEGVCRCAGLQQHNCNIAAVVCCCSQRERLVSDCSGALLNTKTPTSNACSAAGSGCGRSLFATVCC